MKQILTTTLLFTIIMSAQNSFSQSACDNANGNITVVQGDRAFTSLKNFRKQLDLAEKASAAGELLKMQNNLKNAERYIGFLLKKEPNANISAECSRLKALSGASKSLANNKQDFAKANYNFTFFIDNYYNFAGGMFENARFATQNKVFDDVVNFDRKKMLSQMSAAENAGKLDSQGKQLKDKLENLETTLTTYQIPANLYKMLDEVNNSDGVKKSKMSKRVLKVVRGFAAIGGDNATLNEIKDSAERQLADAEEELAAVYTGEFHKEHMNEIVFTKVPYKPGNEASVEINPIFEPGDAIYATMYLSAPIIDAIGDPNALSASGNPMGAGASLIVKDPTSGLTLDRFSPIDEGGYKKTMFLIYPAWNTSETTYQFVLVPNLKTNLKNDIKHENITPVQMARGMGKETPRKKTWQVSTNVISLKTGVVTYKGSFTMNLSKGKGPKYYTEVENKQFEAFIEANELPKAAYRNAGLEAILLKVMNKNGYKEKYTKTIMRSQWRVFSPPYKQKYREISAAFPYKTAEGKCGFHEYSFRAYPTGSGWGTPAQYGGAIARERVSCKKVN
ncbi:hypothetical protein H9W90_10180 [Polaribacter pectinis]|uniref:Uncharacterized protein n=1 Tax=Polaribacter pectinis TaxID=2738844 RepID=A0A7G9L7G4_9FLAO|nr:hypothetical protein [Polaribacter pectinis]QNM84563.1 hypothetical protein H9W90_10180 [Polaribacter pectinis]